MKKNIFRRSFYFSIIIMIMVSTLGWLVSPARAIGAAIQVSPTHARTGSVVTLSGESFTPNASADIRWDGATQSTFTMPGSGSFSLSFTIPYSTGVGGHTITVCQGCGGGEFEVTASTSFTVDATPTNTPIIPTATVPPPPTRTPTRTPIIPTITPTPVTCISYANTIEPSAHNIGGTAGLETIDWVVEVFYNNPELPLNVKFHVNDRSGIYSQWPDPLPGTSVEMQADPAVPYRFIFTIHDIPLLFGYNEFSIEFISLCPGIRNPYFYSQPINGDTARGRIFPAACGDLGLNPDAPVISFEFAYEHEYETEYGLTFENSIQHFSKRELGLGTRSGYYMASSVEGMEFGSAGQKIRMNFTRPLQALGMYVGSAAEYGVTGQISANLEVYGYPAGSSVVSLLGTASTEFGPGPTDVLECLSFRAEEGDQIIHATLDYVSEGVSIAERRLMDDLTFEYAVENLPADLPPLVDIVAPDTTGMFTRADVGVRATIQEDRRLVKVDYRINDGELIPLAFAPSYSEDPTWYSAVFTLSTGMFDTSRLNTFTVIAEDSAGQIGSDSINLLIATPVPTLDLSYYDYEIIQTVQCLHDRRTCGPDNSIPLYSGKPTLVRMYVRVTGSSEPVRGVTGEMCINDSYCFDSIEPATLPLGINPVSTTRGDLGGTLNFLIPSTFTNHDGRLRFSVTINPGFRDFEECCMDNNTSVFSADFRRSKVVNIATIGVRSQGLTPNLAAARSNILPFIQSIFPTGAFNFTTFGGDDLIVKNYNFTEDGVFGGCGDGWTELLADLWFKQTTSDVRNILDPFNLEGRSWLYMYGIINNDVPRDSTVGCGMNPGYVSAGMAEEDPSQLGWLEFNGSIMAHEVGHNFGRSHAPGCGAEGVDTAFTFFNAGGASITNTWGIDLGRGSYPYTLYAPSGFELMGYCGNGTPSNLVDGVVSDGIWVSSYTYRNLAQALYGVAGNIFNNKGVAALVPQPKDPPYLVGTLLVTPDSTKIGNGFYVMDLKPEQLGQLVTDINQGAFLVEILDMDGEVISSSHFDLQTVSEGTSTERGLLLVALPWYDSAVRLVVSKEGVTIWEMPVSGNTPEIRILTPNGGETWPDSGQQNISWEASDKDGDELRFTVQYSLDDGATWTSLGVEQTENFMEVETASLAGSMVARIRVIASDGINTAYDESDASFIVPDKAPDVNIISPHDGEVFPTGNAVIFQVMAIDFEDGNLPDNAFSWVSDLEGTLGQAPGVWGVPLSSGKHQVTVSVTDSQGNVSTKMVNIVIEETSKEPVNVQENVQENGIPLVNEMRIALLIIVGLVGAGMIIIVAILLRMRLKK